MLAGIRGKIEMFNFSAATLERAGLPSSAATNIPPFVVIASNDINQVRPHATACAVCRRARAVLAFWFARLHIALLC